MLVLKKILSRPLLIVIRGYQKTLSPDHGVVSALFPHGFCKYYPSCSEYAYEAISHKGVFYGSLLSFWRVLRCNPLSKGGIDKVK